MRQHEILLRDELKHRQDVSNPANGVRITEIEEELTRIEQFKSLASSADAAFEVADEVVRAAGRVRATLVQIKSCAETASEYAKRGESEDAESLLFAIREYFDGLLMKGNDSQLRAAFNEYINRRGIGTPGTLGLETRLFDLDRGEKS